MPRERKKKVVEFPAWVIEALACPECATGMIITLSGGSTCVRCPAHTGLLCKDTWETRFIEKYGLALARNQTNLNREEALTLARHYLKRPHPFRG